LLLGIMMSAIGLVYTFVDVDIEHTLRTLGSLRAGSFWTSEVLFVVSLALRALRWQWLLLPIGRMRYGSVFGATVVGMMANNVLPARMGELPKALFLARREQTGSIPIMANIVAERVADALALVALLVAYAWLSPAENAGTAALIRAGWVLLVGGIGLTVVLALVVNFEDRAMQALGAALALVSIAWSHRIVDLTRACARGLGVFQSWRRCLNVGMISLAIWLCGAASYYYLLDSFALNPAFRDALLVFLIVLLGIALPSAPGFIGTFHAVCVAALAIVGVTDAAVAAAFATVAHGMGWMTVNVLGIACLTAMGGRECLQLFRTRPAPVSTESGA
jgi:uncharacterized protein (TIRG00374 family)